MSAPPKSALAVRRERAAAAARAQAAEPAPPDACASTEQARLDASAVSKESARDATPRPVRARTPRAPPAAEAPSPEHGARAAAPAELRPNVQPQAHTGAAPATLDTDGALLCGLQLGESVVVRGLCYVHVVRGCASVAGARLDRHAAPFALFVPDVHPAAPICAVDGAPAKDGPLAAHAVVVRLENARCGLEQLARVCPLAGMDPFATERWRPTYTFVLEREPRDGLHVPRAWADTHAALVEAAASPLVVVVRGAKNTGKSTFTQLGLHALLTTAGRGQVAFLELDPGQPALGPPGLLALHVLDAAHESGVWAPSWCTARTPVRAHVLGDVTPRDDPARYAAAARDLIEYFRAELQYGAIGADGRPAMRRAAAPMPLVVNTHGWVKGLGLDLLLHVCAALAPTHVVDLGAPLPASSSCVLPALGDADVPASAARRLNAAEARVLSMLAYLHMTQLPQPGTGLRAAWDFARPLVARVPFVVDVSTGLAAGCAVLDTHAAVDEALQLLALNGRIAALVLGPAREAAATDVWRAAFERGAALVHAPAGRRREPVLSPALGLALVRSIDRAQGTVHLLTPLSGPYLQAAVEAGDALGLVQGALDLPFWGALDAEAYADVVHMRRAPAAELAGVPREAVPYLAWPRELLGDATPPRAHATPTSAARSPAEPVGARPRKVRRNLMRRGQQAT
ncbi:unnamed protein product [Malassezia sympodialis ATCC 42132]|mgnify:CR=1 FL=1|uniref:Polynucleotide 5'-hydroxyl-kinase GRC3 n=1 Tax=Malassezia sympodialis (strain ATCC 42132) TaxID=1230383 RepID=M5EAP3_MALS4|nr:uncharacterized protein MSY001_2011 [Malassezia sympodialis ATCC 42132]CCU99305.1 unnamed protein product [Malassezia sympodialis ATCC 42132]SHO78581.1 Similar to S.cerevisiae protein GRC3 (Polynucleotide kinase present on rDNA) [Malassezia sympodialis ATCC 42132]|eukprot:XP_018740560.1 uncharacterized protein MSY001_2011 [Malassezia sympodialis ATCC 42132]